MPTAFNFYLFGSHQTSSDNEFNHLLYLISSHQDFKFRVNNFLSFLPSPLTSETIVKMGTLIYTLLLPDFEPRYHRKLATELLQSLQISLDHHSAKITYTNLAEYLLKIAADYIENIDLKSCLGFLDLIYIRITDAYIIDVHDDKYK